MKPNLLVVLLVTVTVCVLGAQRSDIAHVLDVLTYPLTQVQGDSQSLRTRPSLPRTPPVLANALTVELRSLERTSFLWGDSFVYEVVIENTGRALVTLPWSPDDAQFGDSIRRSPEYVEAAVGVEVRPRRESQVAAVLRLQGLFGAPSVPGSLPQLAPGERALVRVPGQWWTTEAAMNSVVSLQQNGRMYMRAVVVFENELTRVVSKNEVEVFVAAPIG